MTNELQSALDARWPRGQHFNTALLDLLIGHAYACFDLLIGKRVRLIAELRVDRNFERVRLLNYCIAFEIIIFFYEGDFLRLATEPFEGDCNFAGGRIERLAVLVGIDAKLRFHALFEDRYFNPIVVLRE